MLNLSIFLALFYVSLWDHQTTVLFTEIAEVYMLSRYRKPVFPSPLGKKENILLIFSSIYDSYLKFKKDENKAQ